MDQPISGAIVQSAPQNKDKKDILIAAVVGFICAILLLPIAKNLAIKNIPFAYFYSLIIILPVLCSIGMWVAIFLAKKIKIFYQLARFILVGALNTFIDWGFLNLLIYLTGYASGTPFILFKGASFLVATTNSYYWNKLWTFKTDSVGEKKEVGEEFLTFLVVSGIGFGINVGAASLIVNVLGPQWGMTANQWANFGALCGTLLGLTWNFLGYKLIVFKAK
jgi:putative flippase GtrA